MSFALDPSPTPDPSYFRCHGCRRKVATSRLPRWCWIGRAMLELRTDEHVYVCEDCRDRPTDPKPDPTRFRCLGCGHRVAVGETEAYQQRTDPEIRIGLFDGLLVYRSLCAECRVARRSQFEARELAIRNRLASDAQTRHISDLARHYELERRDGRLLYSHAEASARAVEISMLVEEWGRWPEFMTWLRAERRGVAPATEEEAA